MIDILRVIKPFLIGLAVVLGSLYFFLCVYFSYGVKGSVVDASTGKPIEGAIVVASWSKYESYALGSIHVGEVKIQETLTDKNGEYSLKPWIEFTRLGYFIKSSRPEVSVAMPGYKPMVKREEESNEMLQVFMVPPNGKSSDLGNAAGGISTPLMRKYMYEHHHTGIKK